MNAKELRQESRRIEDCIQESIELEKWKNELFIMRLSILIASFLIFVFSPLYMFLTTHITERSAWDGYLQLFITVSLSIIYYAVFCHLLSHHQEWLKVIRIFNITIECLVISCVFYLMYLTYNGLIILSGPLFLIFVVMILLSSFRLSFGCGMYSGTLCAISYLILSLYIIYRDGGKYPEIYDYTLISGIGVWCKLFFFIIIGAVCGLLSKSAKTLIRKIAIKNYETRHVRQVFGKYVSPEIRDYILQSGGNEENCGREDSGVILFCDVNNFSDILEKHEPKDVIVRLNTFLESADSVISRNGGVINKFVGSCIMAVFGLGKPDSFCPEASVSAVKAAQEMQALASTLNSSWKNHDIAAFDIGIGLSCGSFITGNIGSESRKEFTCLGDVVNVASRLQNHTRKKSGCSILATADIYRMLQTGGMKIAVDKPEEIFLKGKAKPVQVYSL